jgi:hypothetical protein
MIKLPVKNQSDYFYHFQFPFFNVVLEMKRVNFNYQTDDNRNILCLRRHLKILYFATKLCFTLHSLS